MKLGISWAFPHSSPAEWAEKNRVNGLSAVVFPVDSNSPDSLIDSYITACRDYGLSVAEVGIWNNMLDPDNDKRINNIDYAVRQLILADRVNAVCAVNISGARGPVWDAGYLGNYSPETFGLIRDTVTEIIDRAKPVNTCFTLEPMPWMLPWSPESYLELISAINNEHFGVHVDAVNMINCPERYFFCGDFIKKCFSLLHGKIKSVHVKDVLLENSLTLSLREVPCGSGGFDLAAYAAAAEAEGENTPFIIEHLSSEEQYMNAVAYIKNLTGEMGIRLI